MESLNKPKKLPKCPRDNANFFSFITFYWVLEIFFKGKSKTLGPEDLYQPLKGQDANSLGNEMEKYYNRKPELMSCFTDVFGRTILGQGLILLVIECGMKLVPPIFLSRVIKYYSNPDESNKAEVVGYSIGIILSVFMNVLVLHAFNLTNLNCGFNMKTGACSMIYRKCLKLSKTSLGAITTGKIVNLMSNDVGK